MGKRRIMLLVSVSILAVIVAATFVMRAPSGAAQSTPLANDEQRPKLVLEDIEIDYGVDTDNNMIAYSHAIFVGRVEGFSRTRWNQDNGEYYQGGLPYHHVDVRVLRSLRDDMDLEETATITVLGASPLGDDPSSSVVYRATAEHDLHIGDQAVFFVVRRELAWRGGTRPITRLTNAPTYSYWKEQNGRYRSPNPDVVLLSLEDIAAKIAER